MNFKDFENLTFDFQSFSEEILWNSKVFQVIHNLWLIKIKFEEKIGMIPVLLLLCNKWRCLNLRCSRGSIRYIQIRNPFAGFLLEVFRMKETINLVMVLCIIVTFENWFFSFEIQRFTWIDLWTSKDIARTFESHSKKTKNANLWQFKGNNWKVCWVLILTCLIIVETSIQFYLVLSYPPNFGACYQKTTIKNCYMYGVFAKSW